MHLYGTLDRETIEEQYDIDELKYAIHVGMKWHRALSFSSLL